MTQLLNITSGTPTETGALGTGQTYGTPFKVSTTRDAGAIAWYRLATGGSRAPSTVQIHRVGDGVLMFQDTSPTDDGTVGWQVTTVDAGVSLVAGTEYIVSADWPSGRNVPLSASGEITVGSGYDVSGLPHWRYRDGAGMPTTSTGATTWILIAEVEGAPPPPDSADPPADEPDPGSLDPGGSLAWWLHRNTLNPDSAVKLIHDWLLNDASGYLARLTTIEGATAVIGSASSSGEGTAMGRLAAILSIVTAAASVTDDVLAAVNTILGWTEDQSAPTALILDRLAYLQESVGLDMARRNEAITPEVWTLVDTLEWEGPFTWAVPADRYRLHVETVGPFRPVNVVAGLDVLYKSGWWSLLTDTVADERRWLSFRDQDLWVPGVRAPGIIVHPWPEATGTLQAWQRNAPTP